jgi:hypothetical protein
MPAAIVLATLSFLGPSREISHSSSASRDTAVPGIVVLPHRVLSAGADFALVSVRGATMTARLGAFGMLELESEGETDRYVPFPQADIQFWRGLYGYAAAVAFDDLAERAFAHPYGALEGTLTFRHESEHYTGSNHGDEGKDVSRVPQVGDFVMLDAAARVPAGAWTFTFRLQHKVFLPDRSSYRQGPGADAIVRWQPISRIHPFASVFGEVLTGDVDAYLVRSLAGVVLPSSSGDLYVFLSADVGHRKGLAVLTEERTLGFGLRFAFW